MHTPIPQELVDAFAKVVETGDETKVREFLVTHLQEFPEETRDAIMAAFVQEAMQKKRDEDGLIADLQKEAIATAKETDELGQELDKRLKLAEIKENL